MSNTDNASYGELYDEVTRLTRELEEAKDILEPFSHEDLCEQLGGNAEGDLSIIFQRNKAVLRLGDFKRVRAYLAGRRGNG